MFDGIFGGGGGAGSADITNPVSQGQIDTAYGQTQTGLQQQQQLLQALQAQNGVANQGSVFGQQQNLANALTQQAAGQGPNPAQAALNQNTGNNIASQAALMAGQRGAGANAGLIARQAGLQGAGIQQQAVGQGATLQAQQQIAAQQALQQQQQNMAGVAQNQIGNQQAAATGFNNAAANQQNNLLTATGKYNDSAVKNQAQANQNQGALLGGLSGLGSMASDLWSGISDVAGGAGDLVSGFGEAAGGLAGADELGGAASSLGADAVGGGSGASALDLAGAATAAAYDGGQVSNHMDHMKMIYHPYMMAKPQPKMAKGGKVPVMVSPGEKYLAPNEAKQVAKGQKNPMSSGKTFQGKAQVKGDSPKNDTVKTELQTGGVVIPRSIMESPNAAQAAHDFVAKHLREKQGDSGSNEHEDFHEALKKAIGSRGKR